MQLNFKSTLYLIKAVNDLDSNLSVQYLMLLSIEMLDMN